MRQQITVCPIKHSKTGLSYFLSLPHLSLLILLHASFSSLFHFLAILIPLSLSSSILCMCVYVCVSLAFPFFSLCARIGGVCLWKNWTSPVKLVFWGETDGSLCVPDRSRGLFMPHGQIHVYTHTYTHMQGWEDKGIVYAEAELIFMSCRLLFIGKYTFKLLEM